jgi:hypothetical protein
LELLGERLHRVEERRRLSADLFLINQCLKIQHGFAGSWPSIHAGCGFFKFTKNEEI